MAAFIKVKMWPQGEERIYNLDDIKEARPYNDDKKVTVLIPHGDKAGIGPGGVNYAIDMTWDDFSGRAQGSQLTRLT